MHLALCDDEQPTLDVLVQLVEAYHTEHCPSLTYQAFTDPTVLSECLAQSHFDLLIVDIMMPKKTGLDVATELRAYNEQMPIIFLTSSPEFALASYRVHAQDYLLKPVAQADFFASLDRQLQLLAQQESRLLLQTAQGVFQLPIASIVYIEALNHKMRFVQTDGSTIETADTISSIEERLAQYSYFTRPHRSYLVNLRHTKELTKHGLYTNTGVCIPVARGNFNKLKEQYMNNLLFNT